MSYDENEKVDYLFYADYAQGEPGGDKKSESLNVDELSVSDIKKHVDAGHLSAEDVYAAENKSKNPRKGVLSAYAPKADEEKAEDK